MSPAALRLHRKRCAARARLFRKRLCLATRRGVLEQARVLDAIPEGFDEGVVPRRHRSRDNAPDFDGARFRRSIGDDTLLALLPCVPDASPFSGWFLFWLGLRLAKLDDTLEAGQMELLERFVDRPPPSLRSASIWCLLESYDDGITPARTSTGTPLYPNGQPIRDDTGDTFYPFYPSGLDFLEKSSRGMSYPDGSPFNDSLHHWMAPDGTMGDSKDLIAWVCDAAGRLWPAIELGLKRVPVELDDLAWLELAWILLPRDSS